MNILDESAIDKLTKVEALEYLLDLREHLQFLRDACVRLDAVKAHCASLDAEAQVIVDYIEALESAAGILGRTAQFPEHDI